MDADLISKLLTQSPLVAVIVGLIYALKAIRAEHAEREKLWKSILDEQHKKYDDLQDANLQVLRSDIESRAILETKLTAIFDRLPKQGG